MATITKTNVIAGLSIIVLFGLGTLHSVLSSPSQQSPGTAPPQKATPLQSERVSFPAPANTTKVSSEAALGYNSKYGNLPASLIGTELDVRLQTDEYGQLIISDSIRLVFDYFLSTITEENFDLIDLRVKEYLAHQLQEPALSKANNIWQQYISLKKSFIEFEQEMAEHYTARSDQLASSSKEHKAQTYLELLRLQLDHRNQLRAEHLDPEVNDAFFSDEAAYDEYTFSRLTINADTTLTPEDKAIQIQQLQHTLPEDVRQELETAQLADTIKHNTDRILASGGTEQDVESMRRDMFGEEAVERFKALDQQRAEWKARVDDYLTQKDQIMSTEGVTQKELHFQVEELRTSLFDSREQIRIRGMEKSRSDV